MNRCGFCGEKKIFSFHNDCSEYFNYLQNKSNIKKIQQEPHELVETLPLAIENTFHRIFLKIDLRKKQKIFKFFEDTLKF